MIKEELQPFNSCWLWCVMLKCVSVTLLHHTANKKCVVSASPDAEPMTHSTSMTSVCGFLTVVIVVAAVFVGIMCRKQQRKSKPSSLLEDCQTSVLYTVLNLPLCYNTSVKIWSCRAGVIHNVLLASQEDCNIRKWH